MVFNLNSGKTSCAKVVFAKKAMQRNRMMGVLCFMNYKYIKWSF
jgi:hypothetical protein